MRRSPSAAENAAVRTCLMGALLVFAMPPDLPIKKQTVCGAGNLCLRSISGPDPD